MRTHHSRPGQDQGGLCRPAPGHVPPADCLPAEQGRRAGDARRTRRRVAGEQLDMGERRSARASRGPIRDCAHELATDEPEKLDVSDGEGATTCIYLPPFRIDVTVRPGIPRIASRHRVAAAVRAALEAAGAPGPASIGVVLSADTELAELNVAHMGSSG